VTDTTGKSVAHGTISGTLTGSSLQYSLTIPAGGFDGSNCTASVNGTATATATTLNGSYTGSQSCTGSIGSGSLTLDKR
jgi:hypothetical protein